MNEKIIIEEQVLFTDKNFFGDNDEHEYDCHCYDGMADCVRTEATDAPNKMTVTYPKLSELTDDQKDYILKYRGLYDLTRDDVNQGDVMVVYGKIKY